ncbi:MAG: hypothetical protein LBS84_05770 [Clostridiales bacterium]|jgi:hypothetical protein|nr:hypothetical protein [Clostridiales bacterium]
MDYEEFFSQYSQNAGKVKDLAAGFSRALKRVNENIDKGDVKTGAKNADGLLETVEALSRTARELTDTVNGFDYQEYMRSGELEEQFAAYCEEAGLDIKGGNNSYEIFPYRLNFDQNNCEILVNRRKSFCLRPKRLAEDIKAIRSKLFSSAFNASQFARELAYAYDVAVIYYNKDRRVTIKEPDMHLTALYNHLAPMSRYRKDYDRRSYEFDLARLYTADPVTLEDGRRIAFGTSRDIAKSVRVTDKNNNEHYLGTVRFYTE